MPLYEYECAACHKRTEKIQKFSDPEMTECPHCGGRLERVLSAPAFSFSGGGWYKDLYSSAKPAAGGAESGGKSSEGSKPAESSSKPASPSESKPAAAPAAPAAGSAAAGGTKGS